MLLSNLFALFALISQAIVLATAASLASPHGEHKHQHKLRHQHNRHEKHSGERSDIMKYDALENLLKAALRIDREQQSSDSDYDLIENAMKRLLSRRNRSLDNGVIEQQACQHEDLISCDDYSTGEKECLVTATGMTCCRCKGHLLRR